MSFVVEPLKTDAKHSWQTMGWQFGLDPDGLKSEGGPAENEARTLHTIVEAVLFQTVTVEPVIVDDRSRDNTWNLMRQMAKQDSHIRIFRREFDQGKGAALRADIQKATSAYAVIQDADLEYGPTEFAVVHWQPKPGGGPRLMVAE